MLNNYLIRIPAPSLFLLVFNARLARLPLISAIKISIVPLPTRLGIKRRPFPSIVALIKTNDNIS